MSLQAIAWQSAIKSSRLTKVKIQNFMHARYRAPHLLFAIQLVAHLSLIPMVLYGHLWHYAVGIFVYFLTGCFGMSMTYHRMLSHRSWTAPAWFKYLGLICGTLGLTGSALAWASVHREHHRYSDQERDPHSPIRQAWWKVQFFSMYYWPNLRLAPDLLRDPMLATTHRYYFLIQASYVAILLALDPFAAVYAYLVPAAFLWEAGSSVNTFGHIYGYRRFATGDNSRNNFILGFLLWGEGWHNNHHRFPKAWAFSRHWLEVDISSWFIRLLQSTDHAKVPIISSADT